MPQFPESVKCWNTTDFNHTLCREIVRLGKAVLPLHEAVFQGGFIDDSNLAASLLSARADATGIHARAGLFFTEIVACCGCGDEPMLQNAYCEILLRIDRQTAEAEISLAADSWT